MASKPKDEKEASHSAADSHRASGLMRLPPPPPPALAPKQQIVMRPARELTEEEKVCRICLEDDLPDSMIAPCKCKGGSKWVHRKCLDQWRTNEQDRAFSKCTECLFQYHMQPPSALSGHVRRAKFCAFVSRDICFVTILLQLVVSVLGVTVWCLDANKSIANYFCVDAEDNNEANRRNWTERHYDDSFYNKDYNSTANRWNWTEHHYADSFGIADGADNQKDYFSPDNNTEAKKLCRQHTLTLYYFCGFLLLLVLLGCCGSVVLCINRCSMAETISFFAGRQGTTRINTNNRHSRDRSSMYRNYRRRGDRCHCYDCCFPDYYYVNVGPNDPVCCNCSHTSRNTNTNSRSRINGGDDCRACGDCCGGCDCHHDCGGGRGDDATHICLMIMLVFAILMAVIGFFVGIVMSVVACQKIMQRHVFLLHKQQLVEQFEVMDLSGYDILEKNTTNNAHDVEDAPIHCGTPAPSAPLLRSDDVAYLRGLGLMDE